MTNLDTLNLGAGRDAVKSEWNVDCVDLPGIDEVVDLDETPWPWDDASWSNVKTEHVLEHLDDPLDAIREIKRILRDGGQWHLAYPIGHTRFEDPTHQHYWNYHTAAAIVGDREHSHEFVDGFELKTRAVVWSVPTKPWRWYTELRHALSGPGAWLSQIPGLSGEVIATYSVKS